MNNNIEVYELGLMDYEKVLKIQTELFNKIIDQKLKNRREKTKNKTNNYLLFVEHPNVYTLGKSGDINNLLLSKEDLTKKDIQFFNTNRGGDITCHGPGQIVCYPILDLDNFFSDIHKYLRFLEEVVIKTLMEFNIKGERSLKETGVWINPKHNDARKICALGVKASRWVTMHGFALNVNNDLSYFDNIIPCGINNKSVTSVSKELRKSIDKCEIINSLKKNFSNVFSASLIERVN
ncbi:MAG: lipoyl(octanoyl) transferase LipB [Bacteroidota bacterium]